MKSSLFRICLLLLAASMPFSLRSSAAWANLLNYQGQLTDASDVAVADGTYSVLFSLYTVPSGATPAFWSETQVVTVSHGLFNAVLGSATPLSTVLLANASSDIWVSVKVGSDSEMSPRQQLLPAVYATQARNASTLAGSPVGTAAFDIVQLDATAKIPAGMIASSSLSPPLDLSGNGGAYNLNINNTSLSATDSGLVVSGPNAISASTLSASSPALVANGALAAQFGTTAAGVAIRSSAPGGNAVSILDRPSKAGIMASSAGAGTWGIYASSASYTGVYGRTSSAAATDFGVWGESTGAGSGVYGSSPGLAGVQGLGSGSAAGSAGGYFYQGGSGTAINYGVYASASSTKGQAFHALANDTNFYSDAANRPLYGFFHNDLNSIPAAIGVFSRSSCTDCTAGYFYNTSSTTGSGAALFVNGRMNMPLASGSFTTGSNVGSFTFTNSYIRSAANTTIIITPLSSISPSWWISSIGAVANQAVISFASNVSNASFQYIVLGK